MFDIQHVYYKNYDNIVIINSNIPLDNIQKINREILQQNKKMRSLYNEIITRMMMISQKPQTSSFGGLRGVMVS